MTIHDSDGRLLILNKELVACGGKRQDLRPILIVDPLSDLAVLQDASEVQAGLVDAWERLTGDLDGDRGGHVELLEEKTSVWGGSP